MSRDISPAYRHSMDYSQLAKHPEIASQIGVLIGCFAVLERQIPDLFHFITRTANHDASTIIGSLTSVSARIALVETLLKSRNLDHNEGEFDIARMFCEKLRGAITIRNTYAHSAYAQMAKKIWMISYGSDAKRKTKKRTIEPTEISADIERIEKLIYYLSGYLQRNEKPPQRYWSSR